MPLWRRSNELGTEPAGLGVFRSRRTLRCGAVAPRAFFTPDFQLGDRAGALLRFRAVRRTLVCRAIASRQVLAAHAAGLQLDFPGVFHLAFQLCRKVGGQVRPPEEQQGKAGVHGLLIVPLPASVGPLPSDNEVGPPLIPVLLGKGLESIDHAHPFQRP